MEIKEEPFDDEPQNVIKIPSTPTSDTLQVEIKEEDIEQSETELSSHFVAENSRSNERKYKKPMPEEPFDENPQNWIEIPSTPSPERLQLEIKEEDIEQSELDLSPDIVEEENSRSNETQHEEPVPEEPFDEEPQNVIDVPSTLNPSPEILHVEIKEEDIEQSETELSPDIVEEENSRNNERQDEEPMPVQTEKIVARLYYYLKKEYELLEKNNPKCDLGPLTNILQRTADATKLSEEDVLEILKEYPDVPSGPKEAYAHEDTEELLTENHSMSKRKRR